VLLLAAAGAAPAQDGRKQDPVRAHPGVDQKRVNQAIARGVEFLRTAGSPGNYMSKNADELILLTLVHAGVPDSDAKFRELFDRMMQAPLERTYNVSLQAMVLEEIQRVKYQARIFQCAQFLADNQCTNGQWSYGAPTTFTDGEVVPNPVRGVATGTVKKPVRSGARDFSPEPQDKPRVVTFLSVKKHRDGGGSGDNSNSQYAALGIRACADAGIVFPKELIELARKYWVDSQHKAADKAGKDGVATGSAPSTPRGWCYHEEKEGGAYGSMTAGAVGAVCIYDAILETNWKKDRSAVDGVAWLGNHFSVADNPGKGKEYLYYYLYAIERVGMLYDTTMIGTHDWYLEGANRLLDLQRADGSWGSEERLDKPEWGTCFAILFLKQATRRLNDVASLDRVHPK
jgi:hypothetical protein